MNRRIKAPLGSYKYIAGLFSAIFSLLISGCNNSFGPDGLRGTHPLYNEAIVSTINEQFVQNIVRLHYRDPTFFLDVSNVAATLKLEFSGGLYQSSLGSGSDILKLNALSTYSTQPTISYSPLQGENFVKSMLSPIPVEALFSLIASGWNGGRVFGVCVERVNGLENAPSASGPTPSLAPEKDQPFNRLMELMVKAVDNKVVMLHADPKTKEPMLGISASPDHSAVTSEIKQLLGLDENIDIYRINGEFTKPRPDTVSIRTRSLMSIMFYLSHHVDSPELHKQEGLVTVTRDKHGTEFDWGKTAAGKSFHILQSDTYPEKAFVAIPYRGYWFYLADNDLESKSTFMLLTQLFRLEAGAAKSVGPALTIPLR
ncbi:hypothetical protein F6R98_20325 [Candidatus Methylospira mobilis]|uniref:Uncharacterized protein n=1 Tax=Candidatus Methylospira mobilis TaxID=1808979 RepID=A0A5Q0BLG9_9GAMM|nr:hypothetical protein [Candidatus Methylospira mobilis]QFY44683.1 hypothetical protein F6R98_20325 [Candidatus Methylospira mobilis]